MNEEVSGIIAPPKVSPPKVSMQSKIERLEQVEKSAEVQALKEVEVEIDRALNMMSEIRHKLEAAYRDLDN